MGVVATCALLIMGFHEQQAQHWEAVSTVATGTAAHLDFVFGPSAFFDACPDVSLGLSVAVANQHVNDQAGKR